MVVISFFTIFLLKFLLLGINSTSIFEARQSFCYGNRQCGPSSEAWPGICQSGMRQSPINVRRTKGTPSQSAVMPNTKFYTDHFFLQNNGHTVNLDFSSDSDDVKKFPGEDLKGYKYRLTNIHFHWGKNDSDGSEHQIDGKYYSMEMHKVYYNTKYRTKMAAVLSGDQNALVVVAFLFKADSKTARNKALAPIINNIKKVRNLEEHWVKIEEPLDFTSLQISTGNTIYNYKGSLTTPECQEQVNWFVVGDVLKISSRDVQAFRTEISGDDSRAIKENHRPVQKLNGRKVEVFKIANDYAPKGGKSNNKCDSTIEVEQNNEESTIEGVPNNGESTIEGGNEESTIGGQPNIGGESNNEGKPTDKVWIDLDNKGND